MLDETGPPSAKDRLLALWRASGQLPGDRCSIPASDGLGPAPLSLPQERIWFAEQLQPGSAAYNLFFCARLDGHLAPEALAAALSDLVGRHEALRTTIRQVHGDSQQVIDAGHLPALEVADLRLQSGSDGLAAAVRQVDGAVHRLFDLEAGPLARVVLCRLADHDVLGVAVHHLVADGWSLGIALRELSVAYQARSQRRPPRWPALPIQYRDFARWQRDEARGGGWEADLRWWRENLGGLRALDLPTDKVRPPVFSGRGDWRPLQLAPGLSAKLRELARSADATLFMVLLTALYALLHRLSGTDDIAVGANVAGRVRSETFGLIGNFANVLAVRTQISGDPTFRELLGRVRQACLGAFGHQDLPFEKLVDHIAGERDLSRTPIAQVLLVLQPPLTELRFAGLDMEPVEIGSRTARSDLEVHLWDLPNLSGRLQFCTDLFGPATADHLVECYCALLARAAADPDRPLSSWAAMLPEERQRVRVWGRGPARQQPGTGVHELLAAQAQRTPAATAVRDADEVVSYRQLDERSSRLAHYLRGLGVGPEVPVAICLQRSSAMVVAVLAVLKAGAWYVPLDPRYPAARLGFIVSDAGARVVLTEQSLAAQVGADGVTQVRLDADAVIGAIGAQPGTSPETPVHPENLAYAVYTSGSTGTPKGVQVPHRALHNFATYQVEHLGLGQDTVTATIFSLAFDASVAEIFPVLLAGGTLVIASRDDVADGSRLAALAEQHKLSVLLATPTTWRMIGAAGGLRHRLKVALCGAEPTTPDLYETLSRGNAAAWNVYGPTETVAWVTADRMRPGGPVSLGLPGANTTIHLVDDWLQEVPVGTFGELCIGGAGMARGYQGMPAMTAERFVANPFAGQPGERMYRTGDLARWRADGSLEFGGRRDDQVKLRGHRIELGEVEAALSRHPGVRETVAGLRAHSGGDTQLIAWVVLREGLTDQPGSRQLADCLRELLPDYMIPNTFVVVSSLPKTASGKVDRRRLPEPGHERPELEAGYVAPRTTLEREIAEIARGYLGLERVGVLDDFFAVGGNSLIAAKLVAELREHYNVELVLQKLFLVPTIEHLAQEIGAQLRATEQLSGDAVDRLRGLVEEYPDQTVDALLAEMLTSSEQEVQ